MYPIVGIYNDASVVSLVLILFFLAFLTATIVVVLIKLCLGCERNVEGVIEIIEG